SLSVSGESRSGSFTCTTLPDSGENRPLTALTLSTVPTTCPAVTVSPSRGSATWVMSPSCSTANFVMPTVTRLPSTRAHSWSLVYRRLSGYSVDSVLIARSPWVCGRRLLAGPRVEGALHQLH